MTKPGRIPCEVLGCRRTAPADKHGSETRICCGKCWRLGSREDRKAYADAERAITRLTVTPPTEAGMDEIARLYSARSVAFWAVVEAANQARAGIG